MSKELIQAGKMLFHKRELARRNLMDFTKHMFEYHYQRPFKWNWHHGYLCEILTAVNDGELTRVIISEPPSYTKCVSLDTVVPTMNGAKTVRELKVGDKVLSYKNNACVYRALLAMEPARKPSVLVLTKSGRHIVCSLDHPMLTQRGYVQVQELTIADSMIACRYVLNSKKRNFFKDRVESIKYVGVQELMHLEIEETKNFVANGLVSHNTELCVRQFAPWAMGLQPQKKFIYGTYGDDLSLLVSGETRGVVESKEYGQLFPHTQIDRNQNQKNHWTTTQGGRFFATSTSAAITGIHCDIFLLDDPLKAMEAHSKAKREMIEQFYEGSVVTRLRDKKKGAIVLIAQRLHPEDLAGYLLKNNPEGWLEVKLQALNAQKTYYEFGRFSYTREANEPLWIEYEDTDDLLKAKKEMGYNFDVQYQQDPAISEFGYFKKEAWTWINDFDIPQQNLYIMIDPAMSKRESSDNRAITCNGLSINEKKEEQLIVMDNDYGVWDMDTFVDHIIAMMAQYPTATVLLEEQGGGILIEQALRKEILRRNAFAREKGGTLIRNPVLTYKQSNSISKNQKITGLQTYYHTGALKFRLTGRGMEQLQKEFWAWRPDIEHNKDDCIDTVASCLLLDGTMTAPKNLTAFNARTQPKRGGGKTWRI